MKKTYPAVIPVALILFSGVAFWVQTGRSAEFETCIYTLLIQQISAPLTAFMRAITFLCEPATILVACLVLLLLPATRRTIAVPTVASAAVGAGGNTLVKAIFCRPRPGILPLVHETGYSFPSSHSATSAAIGVMLMLLLMPHMKTSKSRALLATLCIIYPVSVGISRIYLGVHYAGDVLAGWLLGCAIAVLLHIIWAKITEKRQSGNPEMH